LGATETFRAASDAGIYALVESTLARLGSLRIDPPQSTRAIYLDSFDGRLFRAGLTLESLPEERLRLADLRGKDAIELEGVPTASFADALPAGPLRKRLRPILSVRRLLPIVEIDSKVDQIHLLNRDRETVLRLRRVQRRVRSATGDADGKFVELDQRFELCPLPGYETEAAQLGASLAALEPLTPDPASHYGSGCAAINYDPRGYRSKLKSQFTVGEPAELAVRRLLDELRDIMQHNELGVRDDLDIEFLHDFRVAVRRSRSCIGQMRGAVDPASIEPFKKELAWLGQITGPTRDLDVFLLDIERYESRLSSEDSEQLQPLAESLRQQRAFALRDLLKSMRSSRYQQLFERWKNYLKHPQPGPEGARPIEQLAAARIERRAKKMIKRGRRLDAKKETEALHQLRIEAKKLRYLLEFFGPLLVRPDTASLIRSLKSLQDVLGTFNDLCVQQEMLRRSVDPCKNREPLSPQSCLVVGRLIEQLARAERSTRKRYATAFVKFVDCWETDA
jgi:CHAD domain-containing protein